MGNAEYKPVPRQIGNAEWTPEKAALRKAAREAAKYNETHLQQAPPVPVPDAATETKKILDQAVPGHRLQPVQEAPKQEPLPPRPPIWPLGEMGHPKPIGSGTAGTTHAFQIVQVSSTSFKVIGGTAAGYSISTTADITGVTATRYVVIEVDRTSGYDADTGIWTASGASISSQTGSYLGQTTSRQIIQVGVVTCSGSVITSISQVVTGNQWAARTGNGTTYVDANGLV